MHQRCRRGIARWRAGCASVPPHHRLEMACFATLPRGLAGEQAHADHAQHRLAALVDGLVAHTHDAAVGLARRRPHVDDFAAGRDGVARTHRLEPADLVHARRAHAGDAVDEALHDETERDAGGLPAAGDEPSVDRAGGGRLVHVEKLGVVLPGEGDDLVARERVRAEPVRLARREVLEIEHGHGSEAYPTRLAMRGPVEAESRHKGGPMPITGRYLFSAAMDVDSAKEALFNEVYDREHVPNLLTVPGVIAVARFKREELTLSIGGERKRIVVENEPRYGALYEVESPEVLVSDAWAKAVEQGRWPGEVRPFTKNRRHVLYRRTS